MSRKNRRFNELKIDLSYLRAEGRSIKHQAFIDHFANVNVNKLSKNPIKLMGIDIETHPLTGTMKLLGFYDSIDMVDYEGEYVAYESDFLAHLFSKIKWASKNGYHLAHWNKLDPFQMFKLFLNQYDDLKKIKLALLSYSKIGGEWNKKARKWDMEPLVKVENDMFEFGVLTAVRSALCFFYRRKDSSKLYTVWSYDIGSLLPGILEEEADQSKGGRFSWFFKGDKELHVVDWEKYKKDKSYQFEVLQSNERDARAAMALGYEVQKDFHGAYHEYPTSLVSQGALARAAIIAVTKNKLKSRGFSGKALKDELYDRVTDIGLMKHYDRWAIKYGGDFLKDMLAMVSESYSGGQIEAIRYGYSKEGWFSDISSAYPGELETLKNLRGCEIIKGSGPPPKPSKNDYIFIRGTVHIPSSLQIHPITIKSTENKNTNIRPTGVFKASYFYDEREFCAEHGATFHDEEWYLIKTKGELSALAEMIQENVKLRDHFRKIGSSSQHTAKTVNASGYGITFECVPTYILSSVSKAISTSDSTSNPFQEVLKRYRKKINLDPYALDLKHHFDTSYSTIRAKWHNPSGVSPDVVGQELEAQGVFIEHENPVDIMIEIEKLSKLKSTKEYQTETYDKPQENGYRGGEFYNPIYASIITSRVRVKMSKAATAIEEAGGKPILLMTDSITWEGTPTMIPQEMVRSPKVMGYFEKPEKVSNIVCLGSGRYGFDIHKESKIKHETKRRGLNIVGYKETFGIEVGKQFSWLDVLKIMKKSNKLDLKMEVRVLVSPAMVANQPSTYKLQDLGRIIENPMVVEGLAGKEKRFLSDEAFDISTLTTSLCATSAWHKLESFKTDGTLSIIRTEMMKKRVVTRQERMKKISRKSSARYHHSKQYNESGKRLQYNGTVTSRYQTLRKMGLSSPQAKRYSKCSWETIKKEFKKKGWEFNHDIANTKA